MSTRTRACAGCGGAALGLMALLSPCHIIPLAMSIGLGLSGSAAVIVGFYGSIAASAAGVATAIYAVKKKSTILLAGAGLMAGGGAYAAWLQHAEPVAPLAIDMARNGVDYQKAESLANSLCSQGARP